MEFSIQVRMTLRRLFLMLNMGFFWGVEADFLVELAKGKFICAPFA